MPQKVQECGRYDGGKVQGMNTATSTTQYSGVGISQVTKQAHVTPREVNHALPDSLGYSRPSTYFRVALEGGALGLATGVWKYGKTQRGREELQVSFWVLQVTVLPIAQSGGRRRNAKVSIHETRNLLHLRALRRTGAE